MKRSRNRSGQAAPSRPSFAGSGELKRLIPPVELLSNDEIEAIFEKSIEILGTAGIRFLSPGAWDILERCGALVDRSTGDVRFPREILLEYVAKAPSTFDLCARAPEKTLKLGQGNTYFGAVSNTPFVTSREKQRTAGNSADFLNLLKLTQSIDVIATGSGYPTEPTDRPVSTRHLDSTFDNARMLDKSFRIVSIGKDRARDSIDIVRMAHGLSEDDLQSAPICWSITSVNSPRLLDGPLLDGLIEVASRGQATVASAVAFAGAMAPITISGALVQGNAETLALIAFTQMVRAGAPVFYGLIIASTDMRSGAPAMGSPEAFTGHLIAAQLARRVGVPSRNINGTTSNTVDAQASYQSMLAMWSAVLGGVDFVHSGIGQLEAALTSSYEKVVLDAEIASQLIKINQPFSLDDLDEVTDEIAKIAPGGHYFGTNHTMKRYRDAFYEPVLGFTQGYEAWVEGGAKSADERATAIWKEILEGYVEPTLPEDRLEEIGAFVSERRKHIERNGLDAD